MKFDSIIFDLDGTLLNTIDDLRDSTNYCLRQLGYPEKTLDEMKQYVGKGIEYMLSCCIPNGKENPDFKPLFEMFKPYYEEHCQDKTAPYEGISVLLANLKRAGVKTAVVTNKIQSAAEELISKMFPDISVVVGDSPLVKKKPEPDGVFLAMKQIGAKKESCAYVGDSNIDYLTAVNSNLPCLSVLWGFRTKEQLLACGATNFFENPIELEKYILS